MRLEGKRSKLPEMHQPRQALISLRFTCGNANIAWPDLLRSVLESVAGDRTSCVGLATDKDDLPYPVPS